MALGTQSQMKIELVDTTKLTPWDKNPRVNEQAVEPVAKSIKRFGFNVPILCNRDYRIIGGHTRWKAAQKLGMRKVPVVRLELSDMDEAAFAIAENKTGELANWDASKLKEILEPLRSEDLDLNCLGFSCAQLEAFFAPCADFPWPLFDMELGTDIEKTHVLLPVKLPKEKVDCVKKTIVKFAAKKGIRDKNKAVVAGAVLMTALGIGSEQ